MDLTCESPQYFNIRHPERGTQTRPTKRPGNNLHCIMAFTMQESGEWGDDLNDNISPEPSQSDDNRYTPFETLASSESDLHLREEDEIDNNCVLNENDDGLETLRRDNAPPGFHGWSDGSDSLSNSLERENLHDKKQTESFEEQVDTPQDEVMQLPPGEIEERLVDTDTQDKLLLDQAILDQSTGEKREGEGEEGEGDQLNKTLTPVKDEIHVCDIEDQQLIESDHLEKPLEGDYIKRSGTYRKNKPSLVPVHVVESPEGGHQLEPVTTTTDKPMMGDYIHRSGTYRKAKPTLTITTSQSDINITDDARSDPVVVTTANILDTGDLLQNDRESGLQIESPSQEDDGEQSMEGSVESGEELLPSSAGLRRSSTFKKEKPTLEVSPIIQRNSNRQTKNEQEKEGDSSVISLPTLSLTVPQQPPPLTTIGDSLTSTHHQAQYLEDCDDSSSAGEGDSYLIVDDLTPTVGVKRSGTFTKEKPEHTLFGDDYF